MRIAADLLRKATQGAGADVEMDPGTDMWVRAGHGRYMLSGTNKTISALELQCLLFKMPDIVIVTQDVTEKALDLKKHEQG